jgi:hypothetical protein
MLTAKRLHQVLYFSAEHHNFRQKIIILFQKYLVDNRSEAWLNLFLGTHKWKLFCSVSRQSYRTGVHSLPAISESLCSMEYNPRRLKIALRTSSLPSPKSMA